MRSILPLSLVMGALAGLLVGGFLNVFNVPVMEWAIELEGAAASATGEVGGDATGFYGFLGSLGMQRIGLVLGLAVLGVIYGAVFSGIFNVVRQALPGWNIWTWAAIAGAACFWSISLFTQLKYPLNPPGVGEEASLLSRQGFQFLFILLSLVAVVAAGVAVRYIHESGWQGSQRKLGYIGIAAAYFVVAVIVFAAIPGSPDAIPDWIPDSLVIMFRTFSILGHLLLWMIIAFGVSGYTRYREKGISVSGGSESQREAAGASPR